MVERKVYVGNRFRHYQGAWYEIVGFAIHTETEEKLVLFKRTDIKGNTWAKPISSFLEKAPEENNPTHQKFLFMSEKELDEKDLQESEVNAIPIYRITDNALRYFRENAKNASNAPAHIIERRLSALIYNSTSPPKQMDESTMKYYFSGFRMMVNTRTQEIFYIMWDNDEHKGPGVKRGIMQNLVETFKKLGLSKSGGCWASKIGI